MPIFATGVDPHNPDKVCVAIGLIAPTMHKEDIMQEAAMYWEHISKNHKNWFFKYPFAEQFKDKHTICIFAPLDETNNVEDRESALATLAKFPLFIPPMEWNSWDCIEQNVLPYGVTVH